MDSGERVIIETTVFNKTPIRRGISGSADRRAGPFVATGKSRLRVLPHVVFLLMVLTGQSALATDSVRCGRSIVRVGDLLGEVLLKCGEPTYRSGNYIVYDMGPASFRRQFLIQSDRVISIRVGQKF